MSVNVNGYGIDSLSARQHSYDGIVRDGLVLHLDAATFNTVTGTTWYDLSGNSNNGTLTNGPTYSSGNGGSIVFDGTDDYAAFSNTVGNGYSQITVSAWVNPSQLSQTNGQRYYIINADDNSSGGVESVFNLFLGYFENPQYYSSSFNGQYAIFGVRSSTQSNKSRPITLADNTAANEYILGCAFGQNNSLLGVNKWFNITGVYDNTETTIYINGILSGTSNNQPDGVNRSVSGNLNSSSITRLISHNFSNTDFSGNISNTQIYNRALSSTEIATNYNALKGRFGL